MLKVVGGLRVYLLLEPHVGHRYKWLLWRYNLFWDLLFLRLSTVRTSSILDEGQGLPVAEVILLDVGSLTLISNWIPHVDMLGDNLFSVDLNP